MPDIRQEQSFTSISPWSIPSGSSNQSGEAREMPTAGPSTLPEADDEQDEETDERKGKKQKFSRSRQACLQVSLPVIEANIVCAVSHTARSVVLENQSAAPTPLIRVQIASTPRFNVRGQRKMDGPRKLGCRKRSMRSWPGGWGRFLRICCRWHQVGRRWTMAGWSDF